jgi:Flp pilus assembly protein protease CpaA
MNDFFPSSAFGWAFVLALLSVLGAASYFDLRRLKIPNWLTIPALGAGFAVNIVRLGWIGAEHDDMLTGALDGLLFSLCGFLLGFGLFLVFWMIRLCGGGDVKLFAAVASWLGWRYSYWLWLVSFLILAILLTARGLIRALVRGPNTERPSAADPAAPQAKSRKGLLPYALPLTVAAAIVSFWFFRAELKLADVAQRKEASSPQGLNSASTSRGSVEQ